MWINEQGVRWRHQQSIHFEMWWFYIVNDVTRKPWVRLFKFISSICSDKWMSSKRDNFSMIWDFFVVLGFSNIFQPLLITPYNYSPESTSLSIRLRCDFSNKRKKISQASEPFNCGASSEAREKFFLTLKK